jgi:hypothetical protein
MMNGSEPVNLMTPVSQMNEATNIPEHILRVIFFIPHGITGPVR